jgi:hypothetical protein
MGKEEYDLTLFPVVLKVNHVFLEHSSEKWLISMFKLTLPCGRVVWLDWVWHEFGFPFYGCHDFCPWDKMCTCEIFKKEYDIDNYIVGGGVKEKVKPDGRSQKSRRTWKGSRYRMI